MTKGRRPLPANVKAFEGNRGKRPINPEPRPTPLAPDAPDWLSAYAREVWDELVPELDRIGILTRIDDKTLAAFCEAVVTHKEATLNIQKNGIVLEPTKVNPAVRVQMQAASTIRQIASEYGLTPYSRSRLTAPEVSDEEAEELLTSKG